MAYTVIAHLAGTDPLMGEVERLPEPGDTNVIINSPRRRDGKPHHYIGTGINSVIFPWQQITFLEILPSEKEEEVVTFYRE